MQLVLISLVGMGLIGCFGATLGLDLAARRGRSSRRMSRPRTLVVRFDDA